MKTKPMGPMWPTWLTWTTCSCFIVMVVLAFAIYVRRVKPAAKRANGFQPCKYDHMILNKQQLQDTKDLFVTFIDFAKTAHVKYFAIAGTLIGAARNGGLIPYDDDIDVGILEKDCDKIDAYHDDDEVYYFEKIFFGYKFKKKNSDMFVDIMVFENKNNEYKIINDSWPNEAFNNINEIFPLKQITYNEMLINAPNSYKTYLDRAFPKWDTKIVINCGHHDVAGCVHERYKIPQEFDINYDNFKYACYSKFPNA